MTSTETPHSIHPGAANGARDCIAAIIVSMDAIDHSLSGSKPECLRINFDGICCEPSGTVNPNPTLFESREAAEPFSRGQWDSALKPPHIPLRVMFRTSGLRVNCSFGCPRLPVSPSSLTADGTQLLSD